MEHNELENDPLNEIADRLEKIERKVMAPPKAGWKRTALAALKIYVFIFSAVGFLLFIGEESIQTAGFSCFGYSNAKDYKGMDDVCRPTHKLITEWYCSVTDNPLTMVLNPIMTPAYKQFCIASRAYNKSVEAQIYFGR